MVFTKLSYESLPTINILNMALLPISKIEKISEKRVDVQQVDVYENSVSGDAIHGGKITNFSSEGIKDKADSVQITVRNDKVEIEKDLVVKGTVTVENLKYVEAEVPKLNVKDAIMIDHNEVIWKHTLGKSVQKSSLTEVEVLKKLQVDKTFFANQQRVGINTEAPSADFSVNVGGYEVITRMQERNAFVGTHAPVPFAIGTDDTARIVCKSNGDVAIGSEDGRYVKMNVWGQVGIGVKNPQESLHVSGNIRFGDKTFASGKSYPGQGRWETGSVVWNDMPEINQPVGWVCIKGGTPGSWRPFGLIS